MRLRTRRGGTLALVLCLFLALTSVLLGAVTLSATANSAAERDYRRSQALALAEAAVAEARAGQPAHGEKPLGAGTYSWSETRGSGGRLITARGAVTAVSGARITRTVRTLLVRSGGGWKVSAWEEGP